MSFRQAISSRGAFNSPYEIETKTHPLSVISCSAVCHGGEGFTQAILKKRINETIILIKRYYLIIISVLLIRWRIVCAGYPPAWNN
jgi:hypothetical protein